LPIEFDRRTKETFDARIVVKEREKNRDTLEKLAELADLHRNYVGGVERGERNIAIINIVRLARALKVKPGKLLETIA
jgi:transcriptional regulator with XRE-family HTH domain